MFDVLEMTVYMARGNESGRPGVRYSILCEAERVPPISQTRDEAANCADG